MDFSFTEEQEAVRDLGEAVVRCIDGDAFLCRSTDRLGVEGEGEDAEQPDVAVG